MVNQQLFDYVKQQVEKNTGQEQIKSILLAKGWPVTEIEEALRSIPSPVKPAFSSHPAIADNQAIKPVGPKQLIKMNKKVLIIATIVVGALLIVGGGVFAYFKYFPSPEVVLQKMTVKISEIKSLEYTGELKAEAESGTMFGSTEQLLDNNQAKTNKSVDNLLISFSSSINAEQLNDPKSYFSFAIKTNAFLQKEIAFGLDFRTIGKIIYLKLSQLPDLGFFDLSPINNQWLKIDPEALKQFGVNIDNQTTDNFGLSQSQLTNIKLAFQKYKVFKVIEKMKSEKIEGVDAYHYKLDIDKEELRKLSLELDEIISKKKKTAQELADFNKVFDESFNEVNKAESSPNIEIWVGKKDFLPYKIYVSSNIKRTDKVKTSGKISLTLNFKNFNQPVKIEVPEAKPIEQVVSEMFAKYQALSSGSSEVLAIDTDKDGLPDQVETIYGTNPTKADTDGDGFSDYDEIKNGYNPLGSGKLLPDMPSLNEALNSVATNDNIKDRDARRIADVRQIMSAVELYYNDAGKYPATEDVKPGKPLSYKGVTFMAIVPNNPMPNNDGSCPADTNYSYKSLDNDNSYTLDYCLGEAVGDLTAGKHQATPNGLSLNGSGRAVSTHQTSLLPTTLATSSVASRDSKRFADVRQIMAALEMYFNDSGDHYPATKDVKPGKPISYNGTTYMVVMPSNPIPNNDGSCPKNNNYVYNRIDNKDGSQSFSIDFCLGGAFGELQAGNHKATQFGIDKINY